jgi:hypothetical protein
MRLAVAFAAMLCATSAQAGEWRFERIDTPARVTAIETIGGKPYVNAGGLWYAIVFAGHGATLKFVDLPPRPKQPENALADGRVAKGTHDIARAWFAEPTTRYDHGVLGDAIEAGALAIETRDGKLNSMRVKDDAVFEDIEPRLADLDGDGRDEAIVVKSYLKRGAALAVIGLRKGRDGVRYDILAETPPLGGPHRWLNPAGIATSLATANPTSRWFASPMSSANSSCGVMPTASCERPHPCLALPTTSPARARCT